MNMASSRKIKCTQTELGKGGFGTVVKGLFDGKEVAVKRVPIVDVDKREEEFLNKYQHPNILKLFHAEEHDNIR